jgi:uncharacterized membrane protein YebE (DUF533 family)
MLTPQEALVYAMVIAAEADHQVVQAEIDIIGDLVHHLPAFAGLDRVAMTEMASRCSERIASEGSVDPLFEEIRHALSPGLRDTAYALICDVIAVDRRLNRDEMRLLDQIRAQLGVDPTLARTVERVTELRFQAA